MITGTLATASREIRFRSARISIGRQVDNSLVLEDTSASRHHASVELDDSGQLIVADLGSRNGTRIGGHLVTGESVVADQDVDIVIGDVRLRLRRRLPAPDSDAREPAALHERLGAGASVTVWIDDPTAKSAVRGGWRSPAVGAAAGTAILLIAAAVVFVVLGIGRGSKQARRQAFIGETTTGTVVPLSATSSPTDTAPTDATDTGTSTGDDSGTATAGSGSDTPYCESWSPSSATGTAVVLPEVDADRATVAEAGLGDISSSLGQADGYSGLQAADDVATASISTDPLLPNVGVEDERWLVLESGGRYFPFFSVLESTSASSSCVVAPQQASLASFHSARYLPVPGSPEQYAWAYVDWFAAPSPYATVHWAGS